MDLGPNDKTVDDIFTEAEVLGEMTIKEKLAQALGERKMFMAFTTALLIRMKNRTAVFELEELLNSVVIRLEQNKETGLFTLSLEDIDGSRLEADRLQQIEETIENIEDN